LKPGFGGKSEGKRPLRRPRRRCGDDITNGSSRKQWGAWTGLTSLRIEQVADFCKHGNEYSVSIKYEEFIE